MRIVILQMAGLGHLEIDYPPGALRYLEKGSGGRNSELGSP